MRICENGIYRDATQEEIEAMEQQAAIATALEKSRPISLEGVSRMLIASQINTLEVDDATAVRMTEYYPAWAAGVSYTVGYKVQYQSKLYRCIQAHTSQAGWEPELTPAMWEVIDVTHAGTLDDPIPASINMQYYEGKYYVDGDMIYLCTRDTGQAVAYLPSDLVDIYFAVVS